jgi:hypothetical protein
VNQETDIFNLSEGDLWEPGFVKTAYFRIQNTGGLSLKYELNLAAAANMFVNAEGEKISLKDYIYFGIEELSEDPALFDQSRAEILENLQTLSIDWKKTGDTYCESALAGSGNLYSENDEWKYESVKRA